MKKITLSDLNNNQTRKTKRWLGLLTFCMMLFGGQAAFAQIAQSYDFDDETLQGWVNSGEAEFYSTTSGQCGGASGIQLNMYTYEDWWGGGIVYVSPNTLTSPNIGTSDGTEASMSFLYKAVNYDGGTAANADAFEMELQWANSSSGPWTTFYTIDEDNHTPSSDCTTVNLTFTPGTGDLYVRFNSELLDEYEDILIYLDDIQISQGDAPCFPPTGLTATDISLTGATLGWTSDGDEFELEWGVQGFEQGSTDGTIVTGINTNSYELTVTEGGNYDFYVRQICDSGESTWAGPFSFYVFVLGDDCSAPITIDALPYTTTDDTANYSDNPNIEGSPGASGCGSTSSYLNGNDVVYSYTADSDGSVSVNLTEIGTYTGIFVYASCEDIGTACIGGNVNGSAGGPINFDLVVEEGETYYFVISTWASPQTTAYTLAITEN
ncbi:MAG TPA: fibronectin type III domain-containing protein, partial [Flavobacterium sp.]|nr:fibronectin type III domain-containing protein [Flavobacterium sp.]